MSASVELVRLRKTFGEAVAVDDVSFKVAAGEFFTLLGSSGSGKTTTLMMIAGFVEPDSGEILIGGRSVVNLPPERRDVGVVFQSYALFPNMTVAQNVAFPLRMRGVGRSWRCTSASRRCSSRSSSASRTFSTASSRASAMAAPRSGLPAAAHPSSPRHRAGSPSSRAR